MPMRIRTDPKVLRDRAEELRRLADDMHGEAQEALRRDAEGYIRIAERAEKERDGDGGDK